MNLQGQSIASMIEKYWTFEKKSMNFQRTKVVSVNISDTFKPLKKWRRNEEEIKQI